jgi:hypothetical protein
MRRVSLAVFALVCAAGCSGRDVTRDLGDPSRSLVRIDLSYTRALGVADLKFDAQAHFVRYRAFDSQSVPTILGFADYDAIPLDSCRLSDGTAALDEALAADPVNGVPAEVALLDAGRIDVRGPIDRSSLRAQHYPELVPFVSGVVYGPDAARPLTLGAGQAYQVSGQGGEEVGPFEASVTAPRSFPSLTLDPLRRGAGDLFVRWAPSDVDVEPLLLEVKWSSRAGTRTVRCRVTDDGEFAVPRAAFDALPAGVSSATVTAARVARAPFAAGDAGRGELTLELRDVAPLQVSP